MFRVLATRLKEQYEQRAKRHSYRDRVGRSDTVNDYDQRSAIGMVRSSLETGELKVWHPQQTKDQVQYPNRDALAVEIAALLEGVDEKDAVKALAAARKAVNAPLIDPKMAAYRVDHAKLGPVGSDKKSEKMFGAQK